ncbi:pseudouridine synthase [Novosphingobium sp. HBC54]|uniref:Pseudouridine synthase n=2 Tax=Novosphingobium cyanobacteriorum TaxID=3024215 RepID=A0ABT6CHN9_9SPHN|nr:pseudouridine synthase [Novosphingobium cyanobacteriorum]
MIAEGRVALDGEVLTTPATVLKGLKGVTVDGNPVAAASATRLFMFHKPSGLITAERDPAGRATIYTALRNALPPGAGRVMPVGRLDLNTEGLLLLTNDGELKRAMELPINGVPRTYRARTFGAVTQAQLEELIHGIEIEGVRYGAINANLERSAGHNKWIELTLTEGKNREVRRVLEHIGLEVSRLLRTRYGPFDLGDLPRGAVEEIPQAIVERFRKALKTGTVKHEQTAVVGKAYAPKPAAPRPAPAPARPVSARSAPVAADERPERSRRPAPRKPRDEERIEHKSSFRTKPGNPRGPKSAGERPTGGRPAGDRPTGGRPTGGRPGGARPGGPRKPRGRG